MAQALLLIGILIALFLGLKALLGRLGFPAIAGYILLGWVLRVMGEALGVISPPLSSSLFLLANIGITLLLFHVGLETHFKRLTRYLGRAGIIAAGNILLSGLLGYFTAYAFGLGVTASLFIGIALTATSIAVSTAAWPADRLASPEGSILLDLVTIDDVVAILAMAFLFSVIPSGFSNGAVVWIEIGWFALKFIGLVLACYLFAHFVEPWLVKDLVKYERMPDSMLTVIAVGLIIAAAAGLLGFSFAIGAFFAGLAFSRDPQAVRMDASMKTLRDLFVPFFFFWIGFQVNILTFEGAWLLAVSLLAAAIIGKYLGTWIPARLVGLTSGAATFIALSTIPRASIAMFIMERGLEIGVVDESAYTIMVSIALVTCTFVPLLVRKMARANL